MNDNWNGSFNLSQIGEFNPALIGSFSLALTKAFGVDYNLVRIADFIEYILEQEPDRVGLNLAAALVYDQMGDTIRAKEYYRRCLECEKDNGFKELLSQKIANT